MSEQGEPLEDGTPRPAGTEGSTAEVVLSRPCPNCAVPLMGHWCYACGQSSEDFHRSVWHLLAEVSEGLTHSDGRLWTTLKRLLLNPA